MILGNEFAGTLVGIENSKPILEIINSDVLTQSDDVPFWVGLHYRADREINEENSLDELKDAYFTFITLTREAKKCRIHSIIQKLKAKIQICSNVGYAKAAKIAIEKKTNLLKEVEDIISNNDVDSEQESETEE